FIGDRLENLPLDCMQHIIEMQRRPEPNWLMLLRNWSASISQRNRRPTPVLPWAPPRIVINREQSAWWITVDSSKSHASFVRSSDIRELTDEQAESIRAVKTQMLESPPTAEFEPMVVTFTDVKLSDSFVPDWKPIYEVDPMKSYSVDKSVTVPSEEYLVPFD